MNMQQKRSTENDTINQIKTAINNRKYAHADEISLLWQHALKSWPAISWEKVMLISTLGCLLIASITSL